MEFKREDGSKVKIVVKIIKNSSYVIRIYKKSKGKRKWLDIVDGDGWNYREKSFPDGRNAYLKEKYLEVVTEEEIYAAMLLEYEKFKPKLGNYELMRI